MDLGQVFTREKIAIYMVDLFDLPRNSRLLDPCFGEGAFLNAAISRGYYDVTGFEIDSTLYKQTKLKYPKLPLYNCDFLNVSNNKCFDGIIMNPPYLRHEKIDDLKEIGITKKTLKNQEIFKELPIQANLYMYFTMKAISLLNNGGELVIIFPSSWQQAKSGKKFKELLDLNCTVIKEIHITGELFERHALVEVVILHLKKGMHNIKKSIKGIEVFNNNFTEQKINAININDLNFEGKFSDIGIVQRGLTTGYNKMFMNPKFLKRESLTHVKRIISSPKSIVGYDTKDAYLDTIFIPDEESKINSEIKKYIDTWKERILNEEKPKTLYTKILSDNNSWYRLKPIESKGILFSYFVRNDMKFVLNENGYIARDNFYIIRPKIDNYLAFALLNNYYVYIQLELLGKLYGAGLLKIQRYDIEKLMLPDINLLTETDVQEMKTLARLTLKHRSIENIEKITKVLEKYGNISFKTIKNSYHLVKKQRLEGGKNESENS